ETLQEYAVKMVVSHPFEMSKDRFGIVGRVQFGRSAAGIGHAGGEKLVGIQLGNIRPEINRRIGGDRVLAAKPMNPSAAGGTVSRTGEPSLITHQELASHRAGIHLRR